MKYTDIVFTCSKCQHELYVDFELKEIRKLITTDCPECGEEPCWELTRMDNWSKR